MCCPLCQTEYRDGIAECSDCHVALMGGAGQARAASTRLGKALAQRALDSMLASLGGQNIPSHCKEIVNLRPQITFFGIPIRPMRSTFEYEVWVFCSDLENARRAIQNI